jgi:type VI protein secretion system component Hcp
VRRSRRSRDELEARELDGTAKEQAGERSLAGEAVRLQELLGNASTTGVIERSALQRETATEAEPAKGGDDVKASGVVMTVADVGSFPLESFSWGASKPPPPPRGKEDEKEEKNKPTELLATKKHDDHSAKLHLIATEGRPISEVVVVLHGADGKPYLTIKLKGVLISSYTMGGDPGGGDAYENFSLVFDDFEQEFHGGGGGAK